MRGTVSKRLTHAGRARWAYVFDLGPDKDGKRRQLTKSGFETRREAEDALAEAIAEQRGQPATPEEKIIPTFRTFFERWHAECVVRECAPKTAERYRELGQYAIRLFGDAPLDQLTAEQLAVAVNRLSDHGGQVTKQHPHGRPLASKTVRHIAFLVQACLQQAVDWDILLKNPMSKVKKPKVPRRRPKVVDRAGMNTLLARAADRRPYPALGLAAATGMRRGELLAVEWTDLDWDTGILEVSKSLEQTKQGLRIKSTKSGETRRFAIPVEVLEVLREHKRDQDHERQMYGADYTNLGLMFARPDGRYLTPSNFGKRMSKLMRSAGLAGITLHSLRHSHASELLSQGAPITAVSERLGHASPNITLGIYSHALPADNQAAAKLWNDAMADVIAESRKKSRTRGMLANVSKKSADGKVITLKSA
jgi:integrase